MMEIDWKYDNIKEDIERGDIVTFEFKDKYYTGIIYDLYEKCASVFNHGDVYIVAFSEIIARANFDDVVRPAKPKSKFPAGALTWDEIRELSYDDVFLWIYFDDCKNYYPAILDVDGKGDTVIVWCASNANNWLREDGYGKDYVCYLNKPDE